jgi:hypothetical protein
MFSGGEAFYDKKGGYLTWSSIDDQDSVVGQLAQKRALGHLFSALWKRERRRHLLTVLLNFEKV